MISVDQQKVSDQLVRLVQVFFALVLGQSLVLFKAAMLAPFTPNNRLAALAWATVFYTTVASWVDWHVLMVRRPYDTRQLVDRFRFYSDVGIAVLYAYLLFTIEPLIGNPRSSLTRHLLGYTFVFLLYLLSGLLRQLVHGKAASKPKPLLIGLWVYLLLLIGYVWMRSGAFIDEVFLNLIAICLAFAIMLSYRWYRRHLVRVDEHDAGQLNIGIDVDGVLADQITGVLPLIKERHSVALTYQDITEWQLPIKESDVAKEIVSAQSSREYVLNMGVHEGAKRLLDFLHKRHRLVIVTARQGQAASTWLKEWLGRNALSHDDVIAASESKKSEHRTDVLIDDYIGNVSEFLKNTMGVAILVDQPWNRERDSLSDYLNEGRLFIVANLHELRMLWFEVADKARVSKAGNQTATR